jgi:DNA-binding IclR family transcriptional regulator
MPNHRPPRTLRRYDRLAVLDYIDAYQRIHRRSPSQRMIAQALAMSTPSAAHTAIHALKRQGLLSIGLSPRGWPANLTITELGQERLQQWRDKEEA